MRTGADRNTKINGVYLLCLLAAVLALGLLPGMAKAGTEAGTEIGTEEETETETVSETEAETEPEAPATPSEFSEMPAAEEEEETEKEAEPAAVSAEAPAALAVGLAAEPAAQSEAGSVYWEASPAWSAVYDGTDLKLIFYQAFYVLGEEGRAFDPQLVCGYRSTQEAGTGSGEAGADWLLKVLSCSDSGEERVTSELGAVQVSTDFEQTGSDGDDRYLLLRGSITVRPEMYSALTGPTLCVKAGGWGSDFDVSEEGTTVIEGLESCMKQARCSHSWSLLRTEADRHTRICESCGFSVTEAHDFSDGTCLTCGYRAYVTGIVRYILNGRTESVSYREMPSAVIKAWQFPGYRTLGNWTVPEEGGLVELTAEPIEYELVDGAEHYLLRYDNSLLLPAVEEKGYEHVSYVVRQVS